MIDNIRAIHHACAGSGVRLSRIEREGWAWYLQRRWSDDDLRDRARRMA
jgi:hypothetical protein